MSGSEIKRKDQFRGKVLKTSLAGALVDIGVNQPAVIHVSKIPQPEIEGIKRVADILEIGQEIDVWVHKVKDDHIELTMFKPLDLEWREIKKGMVVKGKIVRIEKFGAFVEIGAERPGLIHISEMAHGYVKAPTDVVKEEEEVEVEVLEVSKRKKQIKLSMKTLEPEPELVSPPKLPPREKAAKKKKTRKDRKRKDDFSEFLVTMSDSPELEGEAEPTAMEIALREAMDKAKVKKKELDEKNKKTKSVDKEQEDLLARTLEQKVQTS
ncbi:MAG: S1 RNA-binding domain-containing protein [Anaerolineaceae bacterium]|nr:S1 RNA-binding domain-containing protein [Anaerolineaceae bacterium]